MQQVGGAIPLLCDRERPTGQLRTALATHIAGRRGQPVALFVCGREEDSGESFIERIFETIIRKYVVDEQSTAFDPIRIDWPEIPNATSALNGLKHMFLESLGLAETDLSDEKFLQRVCALGRGGFAVIHTLHCAAWDPIETPIAIAQYLTLWERLAARERKPFVVLLFNVIYSDVAADVDGRTSAAAIRQSLSSILTPWQQPAAAISANLAEDLPRVRRTHVEKWFNRYARHVPRAECERELDALFESGREQPMEVVEELLRRYADAP